MERPEEECIDGSFTFLRKFSERQHLRSSSTPGKRIYAVVFNANCSSTLGLMANMQSKKVVLFDMKMRGEEF